MSSDNQSRKIHDSKDNNSFSTSPQAKRLEPEQFRKVFVGSLSYSTTEESMRKHFSSFGELVDCVIMRSSDQRSRGFGFVTYRNSRMVDEMMHNRPHRLDGRELETKRATPREESGKPGAEMTTRKLFVGGIREGINEDHLRDYFSKYGKIDDCVVMKDKETNRIRGFGFVTFDDYDPVDKIVLEKTHLINGQGLSVKKAMPKEQSGGGPRFQNNNSSRYNNNDRDRGRFNNNSYNENFNYPQNNNTYDQNNNRYNNDFGDDFNTNNNFRDQNSYNQYNGPIAPNLSSNQMMPANFTDLALLAQKMFQNMTAAGVPYPQLHQMMPPSINKTNFNGNIQSNSRKGGGFRGAVEPNRDGVMSQRMSNERRPAPYPTNGRRPK